MSEIKPYHSHATVELGTAVGRRETGFTRPGISFATLGPRVLFIFGGLFSQTKLSGRQAATIIRSCEGPREEKQKNLSQQEPSEQALQCVSRRPYWRYKTIKYFSSGK